MSAVCRYHVLRGALSRHGQSPAGLDAASLAAVEALAERSFALEARVLATPEAAACTVLPDQVAAAVADVRGRYADTAAFLADLAANGLDEALLTEALRRELLFNAVLERVAADSATVTEADTAAYYAQHPERFARPETRTARHILITVNETHAENTRATARQRGERLAFELQRHPDRFADRALRHSECPTALQGGQLGTVRRGQLYAELESALFALKAGEVSGVAESPLGFHVLLCEEITPGVQFAYEQVRDKLRVSLATRRQQTCQRDWIANLTAA